MPIIQSRCNFLNGPRFVAGVANPNFAYLPISESTSALPHHQFFSLAALCLATHLLNFFVC